MCLCVYVCVNGGSPECASVSMSACNCPVCVSVCVRSLADLVVCKLCLRVPERPSNRGQQLISTSPCPRTGRKYMEFGFRTPHQLFPILSTHTRNHNTYKRTQLSVQLKHICIWPFSPIYVSVRAQYYISHEALLSALALKQALQCYRFDGIEYCEEDNKNNSKQTSECK